MTITADPNQRFGNEVVMTITLPEYFVVLQHHHRDVRINIAALQKFADRAGDDPHNFSYQPVPFSWREDITLREHGWAVTLSSGILWPTASLVTAVREWNRQMGIG